MSKKISCRLITASTVLTLASVSLTSCDSGPVNTAGSANFELGNRYDAALLAANSTDIVVMPNFLLSGDTFTHDVFFDFSFAGDLGEFSVGFEATDAPIEVNSVGQISVTTVGQTSNPVAYIYDGPSATFEIAEQNAFSTTDSDEVIRNRFEISTEAFGNNEFAQGGSLSTAITGDVDSAESQAIIEAAIESLGINALTGGDTFGEIFGISDTGVRVLFRRTISYVPTSTNADLLSTGIISGNVTFDDEIVAIVVLAPHDGRGEVLGLDPTIANFVNLEVVDYDGINRQNSISIGTFSLDLGTNTF